jgi:hypothetical protein
LLLGPELRLSGNELSRMYVGLGSTAAARGLDLVALNPAVTAHIHTAGPATTGQCWNAGLEQVSC